MVIPFMMSENWQKLTQGDNGASSWDHSIIVTVLLISVILVYENVTETVYNTSANRQNWMHRYYRWTHYDDVIMGTMASRITSLKLPVYSIV